jgi:hypothetical protein
MKTYLIDEYPLVLLPTLAKRIGLNEAIFLQQLNYWLSNKKLGKEVDGIKWIRNTLDEWVDNFPFWHTSTIRKTIKTLVDDGLVLTRSDLNEDNRDRTIWYTIDLDLVYEMTGPLKRITSKKKIKREAGKAAAKKKAFDQNGEKHLTKMVGALPDTTKKNKEINSKELIAEDGETQSEQNELSPPKSTERKKSDLDKIKSELFDFFVEKSKLTEVTLPKEGAARNKLCYDLLLALYSYYRKPYTDHAGVKTKNKYNYDERAIAQSKDVIGKAVAMMLTDGLTIKSVESIKAKMGDVMRDRANGSATGKASLLS